MLDVARAVRRSTCDVEDIEAGHVGCVDVFNVACMAELCGLPIQWFFETGTPRITDASGEQIFIQFASDADGEAMVTYAYCPSCGHLNYGSLDATTWRCVDCGQQFDRPEKASEPR